MRASALPALAFAALTTLIVAQAQATPLQARADQLLAVLNGKATPESLFAPAFLAAVPAAKVAEISETTSSLFGKPLRIAVAPRDANTAKLTVTYERGTVDMMIQLDSSPPNQVTGLLITSSTFTDGLPQIVQTLRGFAGKTGFAFAKLGDGAPQMLTGLEPDRAIALGSAFKLVILAELVRETAAGERQWSDMIALDGRPLPGGTYTKMAAGTKVSLLELAQKMVSISDNSATDILLATLGRVKVEAMMTQVGWHDVGRDHPFLSTLEMFKIKGIARFRQVWPTLDEKGRGALLVQIDAAPPSEIDPALFKDGKPILIDQAEWFASPADMIRTMDWLRKHSESGPGAQARAILAINPGVPRGDGNAQWSYIGFKGGSEPGVVTMTFLLQGKDGWYAMSGGWNNAANKVDDNLFVGLMAGAIGSAGR
jgi:hypothetical protein